MTRQGVLDTIAAILAAVTTPTAQIVLRAEPLSIPSGERLAAFWYLGDATLHESLGDVQVDELFVIQWYWRIQSVADVRQTLELEVWNANRNTQAGLRADSQLGGHATDLKIDEATTGYTTVGDAAFRVLKIPIHVWVYESEPISP